MKVTYGAIVQRASGRFGGTVHSNWKGVDVVRRFAKPSNPNSQSQQNVRRAFAALTQSFTLQSAELRNAWNSYVRGRPLIARNAYLGRNVPALAGETTIAGLILTPGDASTIPLTSATYVGGSGTITPTVGVPTPPDGWAIGAVIIAAAQDWDPSDEPPGSLAQWYEAVDSSSPYNTPISGLSAGDYYVGAFIRWLDPQGVDRYSAATPMQPVTVS